MQISYDPAKRDETLVRRGLDLADAGSVLSGPTLTVEDDRCDYGEPRFITVGLLHARMVVIAWTPRGETHRIISMRKANDREITRYGSALRHPSG
jgi:uncharacterized DUF497 family protein